MTKNVTEVFLKGKEKEEKIEKRENNGELEIGRYILTTVRSTKSHLFGMNLVDFRLLKGIKQWSFFEI